LGFFGDTDDITEATDGRDDDIAMLMQGVADGVDCTRDDYNVIGEC
jgi:hypothetical protein